MVVSFAYFRTLLRTVSDTLLVARDRKNYLHARAKDMHFHRIDILDLFAFNICLFRTRLFVYYYNIHSVHVCPLKNFFERERESAGARCAREVSFAF